MLHDKILIRAFFLCELRALARNLLLAVLVATRERGSHRKGAKDAKDAKDAKENSQGSNLHPDLPRLMRSQASEGRVVQPLFIQAFQDGLCIEPMSKIVRMVQPITGQIQIVLALQ